MFNSDLTISATNKATSQKTADSDSENTRKPIKEAVSVSASSLTQKGAKPAISDTYKFNFDAGLFDSNIQGHEQKLSNQDDQTSVTSGETGLSTNSNLGSSVGAPRQDSGFDSIFSDHSDEDTEISIGQAGKPEPSVYHLTTAQQTMMAKELRKLETFGFEGHMTTDFHKEKTSMETLNNKQNEMLKKLEKDLRKLLKNDFIESSRSIKELANSELKTGICLGDFVLRIKTSSKSSALAVFCEKESGELISEFTAENFMEAFNKSIASYKGKNNIPAHGSHLDNIQKLLNKRLFNK